MVDVPHMAQLFGVGANVANDISLGLICPRENMLGDTDCILADIVKNVYR